MRQLMDEGVLEVSSVAELKAHVSEWANQFSEREIILLSGLMGVGKTEFMRQLIDHYGGDAVFSPTFSIHNAYQVPGRNIEHIDLYRLEDEEDLESTGFWDLFSADKGLIAIEWADRLEPSVLPGHWGFWDFKIEKLDVNKRKIQWQRWAPLL